MNARIAKYLGLIGITTTGFIAGSVALSMINPALGSLLLLIPKLFLSVIAPILGKIFGNLGIQAIHYLAYGTTALIHLPLLTKISLGILATAIGLNLIVMLTPRPHTQPIDLAKAYLDGDTGRVQELTGMRISPLQTPLFNQVSLRKGKKNLRNDSAINPGLKHKHNANANTEDQTKEADSPPFRPYY